MLGKKPLKISCFCNKLESGKKRFTAKYPDFRKYLEKNHQCNYGVLVAQYIKTI